MSVQSAVLLYGWFDPTLCTTNIFNSKLIYIYIYSFVTNRTTEFNCIIRINCTLSYTYTLCVCVCADSELKHHYMNNNCSLLDWNQGRRDSHSAILNLLNHISIQLSVDSYIGVNPHVLNIQRIVQTFSTNPSTAYIHNHILDTSFTIINGSHTHKQSMYTYWKLSTKPQQMFLYSFPLSLGCFVEHRKCIINVCISIRIRQLQFNAVTPENIQYQSSKNCCKIQA